MKVSYSPSFVRQCGALPADLQEEILEKIELFKKGDHKFLKVHKLHGRLSGRHSFSVNFKYRILFTYISKQEACFLVIGDHAVYK